MSAYTVLTTDQLQAWLAIYGLNYLNHSAVEAGIENTTYFVNANSSLGTQEYVLTVFEHLHHDEVVALSMLLDHLKAQGLPVACPIRQTDYSLVGTLHSKPAWLCPKLGGSHPLSATDGQCYAIGQTLAKLHQALRQPILLQSISPLMSQVRLDHSNTPYAWLQEATHNMASFDPVNEQPLLRQLSEIAHQLSQVEERVLGLVHADLFRDNVLCVGDSITGVLDFSEVCHMDLVYDVAITLNDFASDATGALIPVKVSQLLQGYQQVRALHMSELTNLPKHLALASARFWLSRLAASRQAVSNGQVVSHKDPAEMLAILHNRLAMIQSAAN